MPVRSAPVLPDAVLTADLIDCAAEPTQFNGRSLVQIAQALAAPFGIEVVNSGAPSGYLFLMSSLITGETVD